MERNVVVGGLLVGGSLALAMMLNGYASYEAMQIGATPAAEPEVAAPVAPPQRAAAAVLPADDEADDDERDTNESASARGSP